MSYELGWGRWDNRKNKGKINQFVPPLEALNYLGFIFLLA